MDKYSAYENHEHPLREQWLKLMDTIASIHPMLVSFEGSPRDLFVALEELAHIHHAYRGYKLIVPHGYKGKVNSDG